MLWQEYFVKKNLRAKYLPWDYSRRALTGYRLRWDGRLNGTPVYQRYTFTQIPALTLFASSDEIIHVKRLSALLKLVIIWNLSFCLFFLCSITNIKDGDRTWLRLWANIYWGRFPVSNWCHKSERAGFHSLWIKDVLPSFIQWTFFVHSFFQEKMIDRETGWAWWEQALSSIWCHNHFGSWFRKNRFPARSSWDSWLMIIPREPNRRSSWFERSPERITTSKTKNIINHKTY